MLEGGGYVLLFDTMVLHSPIKKEEVPLSTSDLSYVLTPPPSLELEASLSSSSSDDGIGVPSTKKQNASANGISSSSLRCESDQPAYSKKKDEPHTKVHEDIKSVTKSWWGSMLNGYSVICRLTIVLVVILSWYYAHRIIAGSTEQHDEMLEYEEYDDEEVEDLAPWDIWGKGFDFDKQRDFWIADEDLPHDLAADLQSTNDDIKNEALARRQLDPSRWDTFGYWEIYHYYACDKILFSSPRPVWSEQLFRNVRDFYHAFVENNDSPSSTHQANDDVYDMSQNAIPYQSGGNKGRGLKAARDIKRGDVIFKSSNNTIIFNDGHSFRKFLFEMNERFADPGMVCDILVWAWVQDVAGEIPYAGVVDLDNGNLLNDFGLGDNLNADLESIKDYVNIRCRGATLECYASKDIAEGDELLGDYSDFVSYYSWTSMGL